jgi:xanthine phosphoribosyltransferase
MERLKRKILEQGITAENGIIRVDMFLNHALDIPLIEDLGNTLAKKFKGDRVSKVLTAESSGIPLALFAARALGVPAVYAKKFQTGYIDPDVYSTEVHSFSMEKAFTLRVSRPYLTSEDNVLLVDDILSSGQAMLGLMDLVSQAGGEVAGLGVAIEKSSMDGGRILRQMGIRVEALVTIDRVEDGTILFRTD